MAGKMRKHAYRKRIFIYFMAIAVIPLLILGFYSYHSGVSAMRSSIRQSNETALAQIENQTENALDQVQRVFLRAASREKTNQIIGMAYDTVPYPQVQQFIEEIQNDEGYINFVDRYSFINYRQRWVLSNKGFHRLGNMANQQWIQSLSDDLQNMFWINRISDTDDSHLIDSDYVDDHYLMFVIKLPSYAKKPEAAFVVNVKQSALEGLFKGRLAMGSLVVLDQNGDLVYSENPAIADYARTVLKQGENPETGIIETESGEFDLVVRRGVSSGWTFLAGYNPADASSGLREILFTMAGIILVVLLLTGIISGFGSFYIYRPVNNLVTQVKQMVPEKEGRDEFALIQEGLDSLAGHNEELQAVIDRQKTQLTELFAIRLIRGGMEAGEIQGTKERLRLTFQPYLAVLSMIFCPREKELREQMRMDALNLELLRRMPQEILDILLFPPFIDIRVTVMVVDGQSPEKIEEKILALRNCLSVFIGEVCGGYVDMGVSQSFQGEEGFARAYQESLEALKINQYSDRDEDTEGITMEESSVTYYSDLTRQERPASGYDLALDTAVREAVDKGEQQKAFGIVDEFMRQISKSGAVLYEQQYYFYRFLLAILSVPADAGIPVQGLFAEGEENLFLRFHQLYD